MENSEVDADADRKLTPVQRGLILQRELGDLRIWLSQAQKELIPDDPRRGRAALVRALAGVVWFIARAYPDGKDIAGPLRSLLSAIEDLDMGQVQPILQPAVFGNRPPPAFSLQVFRALVASIMEFYVLAGKRVGTASEAAARHVNRVKGAKKKVTGKQVSRWRNDILNRRGTGPEGVRQYTDTVKNYRALYPDDPVRAAKEIANALPRFLPIR